MEKIREGDIPGVQLRCRQSLNLPAPEAWLWVSESDRLCQWMGDSVRLVEGPPHGYDVTVRSAAGQDVVESLRTVEQETYQWTMSFQTDLPKWTAETSLEVAVLEQGDQSQVSILQGGFQRLPLSVGLTYWEEYRRRWRAALTQLAAVTRG